MKSISPCLLVLATAFAGNAQTPPAATTSETVQLKSVVIEPLQSRTNLLSNPSFETTQPNGIPAGWQWDRRNTDAVCLTDREHSHRGQVSILLTNGTAFGAHVYGMLWRSRPARLIEGKAFTMSAWVKSDAPGIASLIGGGDWQLRVRAHATSGQWRRIWSTFTPGSRDTNFTLRISTESPTRGVWIDDIKLEQGTTPTVDPPELADRGQAYLEADEGETAVQGDGPFSLVFTLSSPRSLAGTLSAELSTGEALRQRINVSAGVWRVRLTGNATAAHDAPRTVALRLVEEGREIVSAEAQVRFYSASNALKRLAALKSRLPSLQADLAEVKGRGQDTAYPQVSATVLENFIGYAQEDARRGEVRRSLQQVGDLEQMEVRLRRELKESLDGQRHFPSVPRWTGDKRPVIRSSSFLAPTRQPGDPVTNRPVFFTGYGHFGQVVADMEKWPNYGANIIQIEIGPSRLFPREGQTNIAAIHELIHTLDRAQKAGVAVCLLISPHYLPGWALEKWPHLRKHREGFLQYCLRAPEGQDLLRQFIDALLPPIKDHPALHSICLSNEPVNEEEPCDFARHDWHVWLAKRHGSIAQLNPLCGSNFTSFAEVPLPNPFDPRPTPALWMDYIRFNQEFFAGWHKMLADADSRSCSRLAGPCQSHGLDNAQ